MPEWPEFARERSGAGAVAPAPLGCRTRHRFLVRGEVVEIDAVEVARDRLGDLFRDSFDPALCSWVDLPGGIVRVLRITA